MSTENRKLFQQRLMSALSVSGLKPSELAAKLNTRASTVQSWTEGVNYPRPITLFKIAQILNVSSQWLMGEDVESKPTDSEKQPELGSPPWREADSETVEISGAVLFKAQIVMRKEGFKDLGSLVDHLIRIRHEKYIET